MVVLLLVMFVLLLVVLPLLVLRRRWIGRAGEVRGRGYSRGGRVRSAHIAGAFCRGVTGRCRRFFPWEAAGDARVVEIERFVMVAGDERLGAHEEYVVAARTDFI
jgi:hypothetical protein